MGLLRRSSSALDGVSVATGWPACEPRLCGESTPFRCGCVTGRSCVPLVGFSMFDRRRRVPHPSVRAARAGAWWFKRPSRPRAGRLHRRPGWCDQIHSARPPPLQPVALIDRSGCCLMPSSDLVIVCFRASPDRLHRLSVVVAQSRQPLIGLIHRDASSEAVEAALRSPSSRWETSPHVRAPPASNNFIRSCPQAHQLMNILLAGKEGLADSS